MLKCIHSISVIILASISMLLCVSDTKGELDNEILSFSNYSIIEHEMKIETYDIHIDLKYPQVSIHGSSLDDEAREKSMRINQLLTPVGIQSFYNYIKDDLIILSDAGEFNFFSPPHSYELGIKSNYTMGMATENFFSLYRRSISYIRNSDWSYGALLFDMNTGERISGADFFDKEEFIKYIMDGAFKSNKDDFDIPSYFENKTNIRDFDWFLGNTFINQNRQVEMIAIYGEGPETILHADLDKVEKIIRPEYADYLK